MEEKVWVNIPKPQWTANTLLGKGNILASVSGAELSWGFTAEAAGNTPPAAAAEEPAEGGRPWDRMQGACWSCDRSTYPWPLLPEVRNELRELGSCIECSHRCWEESRAVNIETQAAPTVRNQYLFTGSNKNQHLLEDFGGCVLTSCTEVEPYGC